MEVRKLSDVLGPQVEKLLILSKGGSYCKDSETTVSIHCAPEMSEIDCIGRIETFRPKFVRGW